MNAPERTPVAAAAAAASGESELSRLLERDYSPRYMLEGDSMDKMLALAEQMAKSKLTVPEHLRGNVGDCLAIITQAMLWNMNPFAVAQKTHLVNGKLGYEAQLVNAVVQNSGAVRGAPRYEYRGEGDALECRVGFVLRGEVEITWSEWLRSGSVTTKNSPLWKTNPRQQLGYLQLKNWARAFCPGAILGVYTVDELEDTGEIPALAPRPATQERPALPPCKQADLDADLPKFQKLIDSGKKTAPELLAMLMTKASYTEEQKAQVLSLKKKDATPPPPASSGPVDDPFVAEMNAAEEGAK